MTEHAAVIFVFFFLAEYASIVLMCIFTSILFLGGYLVNLDYPHLLYLISSKFPILDISKLEGMYFNIKQYSLIREELLDYH